MKYLLNRYFCFFKAKCISDEKLQVDEKPQSKSHEDQESCLFFLIRASLFRAAFPFLTQRVAVIFLYPTSQKAFAILLK